MRKKILLVGGDSFSDQRCSSYRKDGLHTTNLSITDIITWPILLAEKLGMDLVCVAQSGAGNEQIYSSIFDWMCENGTDDIGMVAVGWSKSERLDYELTYHAKRQGPEFVNNTKCTFGGSFWHNTRVAPRGEIHGWIKKSVRNFYNLQLLCEFHNIPYKQFQMLSLFTAYVSEYYHETFKEKRIDCINTLNETAQFDLINKDNFIGWPIYNESGGFVIGDKTVHKGWHHFHTLTNDKPESPYYNSAAHAHLDYVVSSQDSHPNKAGHELIMEFIYENL